MYIYIFSGLLILGFLIQLKKYYSVIQNMKKLTEIYELSKTFYSSILDKNSDTEHLKLQLDALYYEYNKFLKKKFFIVYYSTNYEVFEFLLTKYKLLSSIVETREKDTLLNNVYSKLNTSYAYNNSYYEDLTKEEFKKLINPLLYLGFSFDFIFSSVAESANLKLPKSFESILSVLSALFTIIQALFFFYDRFYWLS